jgi:hypothetical protein
MDHSSPLWTSGSIIAFSGTSATPAIGRLSPGTALIAAGSRGRTSKTLDAISSSISAYRLMSLQLSVRAPARGRKGLAGKRLRQVRVRHNSSQRGKWRWSARTIQAALWVRCRRRCVAISLAAGRARKAEGGFVVNGRWPFSSAVDNSEWNMLAVSVLDDDGKTAIDWRLCLVPKSDYEIIDTWYAMGMAATGSKDVSVTELFVPERRALALQRCRGGADHPGAALNAGALFRIPIVAASGHPLAPAALGASAIDDAISASGFASQTSRWVAGS